MGDYTYDGPSHDQFLPPSRSINSTTTSGSGDVNGIQQPPIQQGDGGGAASATDEGSAWWWLALLFFVCFALKPRKPNAAARAMMRAREERLRAQEEQFRIEAVRADPEKRQKVIQQSLCTRRVIRCDGHGALFLGDDVDVSDAKTAAGVNENHDSRQSLCSSPSFTMDGNNDDRSSECIICFEPFRVGDTVSFVSNPLATECRHVFHKDCLMTWVANPKHNDCPSCRYQILQFPEEESDESVAGVNNHDHDTNGEENAEVQSSSVAFCIMDGLISRVRRASTCCSLIGSFVETDQQAVPPPPIELRRVVSEGPGSCCKLASVGRRDASSPRRRSLLDSTFDTLDTVPESPFRRTTSDDDESLGQIIRLTRSVSEGPVHQFPTATLSFEESMDFIAAGRIAFQRVSSGIRSSLSIATYDSDGNALKANDSDDEDVILDEEDVILVSDDSRWEGGDYLGTDVELGSPIRRHPVGGSTE